MVAWHQRDSAFPVPQAEGATFASESLIQLGLISNSPSVPTYAFSIPTLETFRRLRLRAPRLSVQAFLKAVCDSHNNIYRAELATPFAEALDVYLALLRLVNQQVAKSLSHDSPNWHIKNTCPPCTYKLVYEPPLHHNILLAIDGGNSLKRFSNTGTASDNLAFNGDYFVPREEVDKFARKEKEAGLSKGKRSKGKGKGKKAKGPEGADAEDDAGEDEHVEDTNMELDAELGGDGSTAAEDFVVKNLPIGEGADNVGHLLGSCTERWKASTDDTLKKTFSCFKEAGVFVCLCCHGHVLAIADMVSSGEL